MADGLAAPHIGGRCLRIIEELVVDVVGVSDEEIVAATVWLYNAAKLACEPAGAATTAALLSGRALSGSVRTAVAVVSGGNVDPQVLQRLLRRSPRL